jgi:hypothetical protein
VTRDNKIFLSFDTLPSTLALVASAAFDGGCLAVVLKADIANQ